MCGSESGFATALEKAAETPPTVKADKRSRNPRLVCESIFCVYSARKSVAESSISFCGRCLALARFTWAAVSRPAFVGKIVGGALAPALAGSAATRYGLAAPLWIASAAAVSVLLASLFMTETAPSKTGQRKIA